MSGRSFVAPPPLYEPDDSGTLRSRRSSVSKVASSPVDPAASPTELDGSATQSQSLSSTVSKAHAHAERARCVLQKHPVEMYDCRAVARDGIPDELRGAYWRVLLDYLPLRPERWASSIDEGMRNYDELLRSLLDIDPETGAPRPSTDGYRIDVDIPRTMPAMHFFACEDVRLERGVPVTFSPNQHSLRRVLYLYAKCNPGLGYVQGMNELVGHMLYTFATSRDETILPFTTTQLAIIKDAEAKAAAAAESPASGAVAASEATEEGTGIASALSSSDHLRSAASTRLAGGNGASAAVEADVFFCFQKLTAFAGDTFCRALDSDVTGVHGTLSAFGVLIYCCDKELSSYLESIGVIPELYAFRWITVFLTQEFLLPEVLRIWDFLFSFGSEVRAALFFTCAAMLILVRDQIMGKHFAPVVTLLQAYPPPDDIRDLLYLTEQLIASQGLDLISKILSGEVKKVQHNEEEDAPAGGRKTAKVVEEKITNFLGLFMKTK